MTHSSSHSSALDRVLAAAIERHRANHPASAGQLALAAEVMPGGNTRCVLFQSPFPPVMVRGAGCRLKDSDGQPLLGALGEFTAWRYGHSAAPIRQDVVAALDGGMSPQGHPKREYRIEQHEGTQVSPPGGPESQYRSAVLAFDAVMTSRLALDGHQSLLRRGVIMARRGFTALPLPFGDAEAKQFATALDEVLATHQAVLAAAR